MGQPAAAEREQLDTRIDGPQVARVALTDGPEPGDEDAHISPRRPAESPCSSGNRRAAGTATGLPAASTPPSRPPSASTTALVRAALRAASSPRPRPVLAHGAAGESAR